MLVRHGESVASVNRSIGGPAHVRRAVRPRPPPVRAAAPTASPRPASSPTSSSTPATYPRAIETAELIAPALGDAEVHVDDRFGEHDPGPDCDGLTFDEFIERHGMPDWETDPHAVTFPGGETIAELHHRVGQAVSDAVDAHVGRTIVVCCHGGVVNAVLRMALRAPATGGFELFTTNTSLTELRARAVRVGGGSCATTTPPTSPGSDRRRAVRWVVVGGGSAGCVVAGRLAEAGHDVTLVEAGAAPPPVRPSFLDTMAAPGALFPGPDGPRPRPRRLGGGQRDGGHAR